MELVARICKRCARKWCETPAAGERWPWCPFCGA